MPKSLSVYLDLIRLLAALLVFIVHANYEGFTGGLPVLWRLGGLGNDAVMVFFVLSGFVIAHVVDSRPNTPADYFSARLSRLWSVSVPALVATIALDSFGRWLTPALYAPPWFESSEPIWRTLANIFFVNELWFSSVRAFSNGPYWSIAYEFWYYMLFGAATFLRGGRRTVGLIAIALLIGPKILLLLPVWLAGVWAYRTRLAAALSPAAALLLLFGSLGGYLLFRVLGTPEVLDAWVSEWLGHDFAKDKLRWSKYFLSSYCIGAFIAVHFVAARAVFRHWPAIHFPGQRAIVHLAGFSFALYLFHYPLLYCFSALAHHWDITGAGRYASVPVTLLLIWLIGPWVERQKTPLRRLLLAGHGRLVARA
jgi:peptidoglycan/LPS O-acetylase OafA/YrhL